MADLIDYIKLSSIAMSIDDIFIEPTKFVEKYKLLPCDEQESFLSHFIVNNKPFAFNNHPLIYEQIIRYLSKQIDIPVTDIKLIGSAKVGFSISKEEFGKIYTTGRDMDFSLINERIFLMLENEFTNWLSSFNSGLLIPNNPNQARYWSENKSSVPLQIKRGFIDTYKIPNLVEFPKAKAINNSMYMIKKQLFDVHEIQIKGASARVYKSWNTFIRQIKLNTEAVLKDI